jgi:integrase
MSLRIKNDRYEYRFEVNGQKVRESTSLEATGRNATKNRKLAEDMERAHRVAILEGRAGIRRLVPRTFSEASTEYLASLGFDEAKGTFKETDTKESTAKRIRTSMASLRVFFEKQTMVGLITPGDVHRYKLWRLQEHDCEPVTVRHDLDALSLFFQWAVLVNYARENVTREVEKPSDKDARREHIISEAEERLYFAAASKTTALVLHDVARLILLQGCRPDEVMSLRRGSIDLDAGRMTVTKSKTDAGLRTLKLTDESSLILARRLAIDTASEYVFPGEKPGTHISKLNCPHDRVLEDLNPCTKCGRPERAHAKKKAVCTVYASPSRRLEFVLYDLRHTFSTRAIRAGISIMDLSKILGHTSIKVTERYVHLSQEDMDSAMSAYNQVLRDQQPKDQQTIN